MPKNRVPENRRRVRWGRFPHAFQCVRAVNPRMPSRSQGLSVMSAKSACKLVGLLCAGLFVSQAGAGSGALDSQFRKVVLDADYDVDGDGKIDDTLVDVMELSITDKGLVLFIERGGSVKLWSREGEHSILVGKIGVFRGLEDGLLGIALDKSFADTGWVYLYYAEERTYVDERGRKTGTNRISRFTLSGDRIDPLSERVLLGVPTERDQCCHSAGSLAVDRHGNLLIATGDNTQPAGTDGYAPLDERVGREAWNSQRSAGNANDLRGKILRIHPESDGTYTIPHGNLFPLGTAHTKPEIFTMGNRNPFRISVDDRSGFVYWGDVGPDAYTGHSDRGPAGFDEINRARVGGNFGWPYFIADNKPYRRFDFNTKQSGEAFNPAFPVNKSILNTGPVKLPPAQPAFIWYPAGLSTKFLAVNSGAGRVACAGPVYYYDEGLESPHKLPKDYDHALFIYDWSRNWVIAVHLDGKEEIAKKSDGSLWMERFCTNLGFKQPIDLELGPDGCLYVVENGAGWAPNTGTRIERIEFHGE